LELEFQAGELLEVQGRECLQAIDAQCGRDAGPRSGRPAELGRHGNSIHKTYQFDEFSSAAQFAGRVADAAAAAGRQPGILIRGSRITLELSPGTAGMLTLDDLAVAGRFERLVSDHHHPVGRAGPWRPSGRLTGIRPRPVGPAGP
jgi:pterin-4a-carbinolamine dehydratase